MSQILLVATSDARRAVQVAFERWKPDLWDVQQVAVLPRVAANGASVDPDLLDETIMQVQRLTPRPIRLVAGGAAERSRELRGLAERQGIEIATLEEPALRPWLEAAYRIELVSGAGLSGDAFPGLALAARNGMAAPLPRPHLVLLDALLAPRSPAQKAAEIVALSDDPVAIDLVAAGLYRAQRAGGFAGAGPLTALPPFRNLDLRASLPLRFETDGAPAAEFARQIRADL